MTREKARKAASTANAGVVLMSARQLQLYASGASWERMGFGIDTRNVSILVGCMLALAIALPGRRRLMRPELLALPAAACVVAFFFVDFGRELFAGPLVVFAIFCAALIIGVLDGRSPIARVLSVRPMVFVGRISYSLYLWHFPVFVILDVNKPGVVPAAVPALLITVACAVAVLRGRASVPATEAGTSFVRTGCRRVLTVGSLESRGGLEDRRLAPHAPHLA